MTEYQIPLIVSSDPNNGASQISDQGSRFELIFQRPLIIPPCKYCWIEVEQSTIVFNNPNITSGINSEMKIDYDNTVDPPSTFNISIETGLYDLDHLNAAIQQQLTNLGAPSSDLVTLIPDTATQRVILKLRLHTQVDFTINFSFREILGFNSRLAAALHATVDNQYEEGDTTAGFNTILYYLIHSDLINYGIRINNAYTQVIMQVPISVAAGSQIVYEPFRPTKIPSNELRNKSLRQLHFWLTDDSNNFVNTLNEVWSCRFVIHYIVED